MLWHVCEPITINQLLFPRYECCFNYPFEILFVACCNYTLHIHFVKFPIELRNCALCWQTPASCVCCFKRAVKAGPSCSKCKLDTANCTYSWWAGSVRADFWREMCLHSSCLDRALSPPLEVLHYWQGRLHCHCFLWENRTFCTCWFKPENVFLFWMLTIAHYFLCKTHFPKPWVLKLILKVKAILHSCAVCRVLHSRQRYNT